ncbi:MAG: C40 family peptidase [Clostridia bacterium]|nr:C40 family peptidase [Clostridia bacterium]
MIELNDLIGTPYKDHGRDASGFDCYGLAIEVSRRFGYKLDDVVYENHNIELSNHYTPTLNVTPVDKPFPGAVIEMQYGKELHIGVCLSDREFIHMTKHGCMVSRIGTVKIRGLYVINTRI